MCEFTKSDIKTSQWVKTDRQAEGFGKGGKKRGGKGRLEEQICGVSICDYNLKKSVYRAVREQ